MTAAGSVRGCILRRCKRRSAFPQTGGPGCGRYEYHAAYRNIQSACASAQAIVDSYIGGRYTLPLSKPFPPQIVEIASNLALCSLYDRRRELDVPEGIKDRRARYLAMLKDIQSEKASVPELRRPTPASALVTAPPPTFSQSLLSRM